MFSFLILSSPEAHHLSHQSVCLQSNPPSPKSKVPAHSFQWRCSTSTYAWKSFFLLLGYFHITQCCLCNSWTHQPVRTSWDTENKVCSVDFLVFRNVLERLKMPWLDTQKYTKSAIQTFIMNHDFGWRRPVSHFTDVHFEVNVGFLAAILWVTTSILDGWYQGRNIH